ncbi:hypothetical protein COU88_02065 [Candidatus Roizmanbacteria bacterium CG10_big_fil_rev_8_21_14_0_10_39_6]|uniref:Uncharacterized protein n=1 Tax=Candidatus Roizmanbacteria bacterium CG10_big_fil_rev_8_21_14_0_10_39_6 TaxID=1974853 RepID=A0A2M8KSR5_9BACT|nr:MAG: hypothetical protein COU88_02065 [Candidatus Roizmanbacteria bacterium CG10_big_fil_rev_8_21_14_0_10_39_6]
MSAENLKQRFAHIFLTAIIALTLAGSVDSQTSTDALPPCIPAEWIQVLDRGDTTTIGPVSLINSGGELIVDPNTRDQPTVKDGTVSMATNDGIQVTIQAHNRYIWFTDGLAIYHIMKGQEPFDAIKATVIKTCNQAG